MSEEFVKWLLAGMSAALVSLAYAFWKVLGWWRAEARGRLQDAKRIRDLLKGGQ